jgi:hypothetical protein
VHTAIVIAVGLVLLAACLLVGGLIGGPGAFRTAALIFLPLWFVAAGINMSIGVRKAGYTIAEETPVFLLVFGVPAVVALLLRWRLH